MNGPIILHQFEEAVKDLAYLRLIFKQRHSRITLDKIRERKKEVENLRAQLNAIFAEQELKQQR